MIRINQVKMRPEHTEQQLYIKAAQILKVGLQELDELVISKKSLDARKKDNIFYSYVIDVKLKNEKDTEEVFVQKRKNAQITIAPTGKYQFPLPGSKMLADRPVIIGAGPAGLFCAYFLAKHGYRPIVLERGRSVEERQKDVEEFWKTGVLHPQSNVQFGEGGAGTFSDGKLNTLVKDRDGSGREVLRILVECGAQKEILYENKPHIGTDILCRVVKALRQKIETWGGEIRFEHTVTNVVLESGHITGITVNHKETHPCSVAVLAIGHSARDTFEMLYRNQIPMEAKSFAVGFRVEHPQALINNSQYGETYGTKLPPAAYKIAAQTSVGRGVYSFCMCPGGYVVNASSEEGRLAINGMSYSTRDGSNANSAIIVAVTPRDFESEHPLCGIAFQRMLEEKAYQLGQGKIPVQRYGEFRQKITKADAFKPDDTSMPVEPNMKGCYIQADLTELLPEECSRAFVEGMEHFGTMIKGFNRPETLLSGIESRTSSPVRIMRDETMQSAIKGLYPCGEGAGYAGGITSAAMDGIRIAENIAKEYAPFENEHEKAWH